MQKAKVCIDEIEPGKVEVDFALSTAGLVDEDSCYGFAFAKTLEHLGLVSEVECSDPFAAMRIEGSVPVVQDRVPELGKHIGLIARFAADRSGHFMPQCDKEWVGRILGRLTQHELPGLPENATLMRAMGVIVAPFARASCDDGVRIYYARKAPWRMDRSGVIGEDGLPLGPFDARDIGGLLIGPDGLPARELFKLRMNLDHDDVRRLKRLTTINNSTFSKEVEASVRMFLGNPNRPEVAMDTASDELTTEEVRPTYQNITIQLPRLMMEELTTQEYGFGVLLSDVLRRAIKIYIATIEGEILANQVDKLEAALNEIDKQ